MNSSSVITLAMRHAVEFDRRNRWAALAERISRAQAWVSLRWSRLTLAGLLRRDAAFMADQAVWHRGAAASLDKLDRAAPLDPKFAFIERLHATEGRILGLRQRMLDFQNALRQRANSNSAVVLSAAISEWSAAAADCFEALRDLRGALQAYEADCCAIAHALQHQAHGAAPSQPLDQALDDVFRAP